MLHRRKGKNDVEGEDLFGEGKKVKVNATKRAVLGQNFSLRSIFIATVMLLALITQFLRAPDAPAAAAYTSQSSPHNNVTSTRKYTPPSFLQEAIDHCKAAKKEHGEYPFMSEEIVEKRQLHLRRLKDNFISMINDKLGGYMFATKHGVRTPRVLFCGKAKDISKSMDSFGNKYVIKPLKGHSAQGVKVVRDGLDIMANESVGHDTLTEEYHGSEKEMMVEELIESANPKYGGLIPPDYKFFTYGGGRVEMMWYIDRYEEECCSIFDVSSNNGMRFMKDVIHHQYPTPLRARLIYARNWRRIRRDKGQWNMPRRY